MDGIMPILKSKEWITIVACMMALAMLTVAVSALPAHEYVQMEYTPGVVAPTEPVDTIIPTTVPDIAPTEPVQPTEPTEPTTPTEPVEKPTHLGAISQPSLPQAPLPPVLELNTLKYKDFTKKNGYITCKTEEVWLGIDVSVWQEDIDWEKVAASGVKFAMIRLAYRGWGKEAELQLDPRGEENLKDAMAAGIKVGVYIYSQATNVQEAIEEAQFLLELLDGRKLDMPVVFDWEVPSNSGARTKNVKAKTIHACAMAFCAEIKAAGYQPMVYFNQWQGMAKYNLEELRAAGVELWLAMYTRAMTYEYKVQMWQYTSKGKVPGIDGRVDIDLYFPNH